MYDVWREKLVVQPIQAVDDTDEKERHKEGMYEEEPMPESGSSNESAYSGPAHDDMCRLIRETLEAYEESSLGLLVDDRFKSVVPALFEKSS